MGWCDFKFRCAFVASMVVFYLTVEGGGLLFGPIHEVGVGSTGFVLPCEWAEGPCRPGGV